MPAYACKHSPCPNYLPSPGYCDEHRHLAPPPDTEKMKRKKIIKAAANAAYDQHRRDPIAKAFYNSRAWKIARQRKLLSSPVCERCDRVMAQHVHHDKPLAECTPAEKLDQSNLVSLCARCHTELENERRQQRGV